MTNGMTNGMTNRLISPQTLLRIWDIFLLEGPKVLFRFCLAILHLHEKEIQRKTDTIGVMRHLKSCARISYDVDGLVQVGTSSGFPIYMFDL